MTHRNSNPPPVTLPALTLQAFKVTHQDTERLENLARKLSARSGRAASRSAALRALIRLSAEFDGTALDRLAALLAEEFTAGVRWGREKQTPPVCRAPREPPTRGRELR